MLEQNPADQTLKDVDLPLPLTNVQFHSSGQFAPLLTEVINSCLNQIDSPDPEISFAGFLSLYRGLQHHPSIVAPMCCNGPFFARLFAFLSDHTQDYTCQDYTLQIIHTCLSLSPDCATFLDPPAIDLILQTLPAIPAAELVTFLCRHFPAVLAHLYAENFPSFLLTLIGNLSDAPLAQCPLLQLITDLATILEFSDSEWSTFFDLMAVSISSTNPTAQFHFFSVLRSHISEPIVLQFETRLLPSLWSLFLVPKMPARTRIEFLGYLCQIAESCPEQADFLLDEQIAARFVFALPKSQPMVRLIFKVVFAIAKHSEEHCVRLLTPEFWQAMLDVLEDAPFAGRQACAMFLFFVILNVTDPRVVGMILESREGVVRAIDLALATMEEDARMTAFQVVQAVLAAGPDGIWGLLAVDLLAYLHSDGACVVLEGLVEDPGEPSSALAAELLGEIVEGTL
jgi:hypothetical protein